MSQVVFHSGSVRLRVCAGRPAVASVVELGFSLGYGCAIAGEVLDYSGKREGVAV